MLQSGMKYWNSWSKALTLTILLYLLMILLFLQTGLPEPEKQKHTPLRLSMFEEPAQKQDIVTKQPQKTTKSVAKKPKNNQMEPRPEPSPHSYSDKRKNTPVDTNTSVMDPDYLKRQTPVVPSFSEINALFKKPSHTHQMNKELKNLYGDSIEELTDEELEYLDENLNRIGFITQKYLEFPTLAGNLGMHGETILEFYLYPNGDISEIKLLKGSGYTLLDENAIETVEVAYKEYPHPGTKTKIRLLVKYINDYVR